MAVESNPAEERLDALDCLPTGALLLVFVACAIGIDEPGLVRELGNTKVDLGFVVQQLS